MDNFIHHNGFQFHSDIAGGCLTGLHQVLGQLLQPVGLTVQHCQIFLGGRRKILLFQQVHIVDNAGKGRFNVVGDIGDELCLQPLTLQPLLHGLIHTNADGV